jgi:oligosaccharyltransferase complex subunit alpha (ribophorin I)
VDEMSFIGVSDDPSIPEDVVCSEHALLSPLKKGEERNLVILLKETNHLVPFPRERKQLDLPMVLATVPGTMLSMYEIAEEVCIIKLSSSHEAKKVSEGGRSFTQEQDVLTLETAKNVKPFTKDTMKLHVNMDQALLRAKSVERDIYVSHWGEVSFKEVYDIKNEASAIKGEFSRLDMVMNTEAGSRGAALYFKAGLPGGAYDIRYRDEIGNISTSAIVRHEKANYLAMSLEPRFPLFGGWSAHFTLEYKLGLNWLVMKDENARDYEMIFTSIPVLTDLAYDDITTRIHLPEGSSVKDMPSTKNQQSSTVSYERTFLSVLPRPVVEIRQRNIVAEQALKDPIGELSYSYNPLLRYDKALAAVFVIMVGSKLLSLVSSIQLDSPKPKTK